MMFKGESYAKNTINIAKLKARIRRYNNIVNQKLVQNSPLPTLSSNKGLERTSRSNKSLERTLGSSQFFQNAQHLANSKFYSTFLGVLFIIFILFGVTKGIRKLSLV